MVNRYHNHWSHNVTKVRGVSHYVDFSIASQALGLILNFAHGTEHTNDRYASSVAACTQAFPFSARHGLEWYEFDLTYTFIRFLQAIGLAWDVQLPTEKQKASKRKVQAVQSAGQSATASAINALDSRNMVKMLTRVN